MPTDPQIESARAAILNAMRQRGFALASRLRSAGSNNLCYRFCALTPQDGACDDHPVHQKIADLVGHPLWCSHHFCKQGEINYWIHRPTDFPE